jgi:hypothetical protein
MEPNQVQANRLATRKFILDELENARAKQSNALFKIAEGQKELEEAKAELAELTRFDEYLSRRLGINEDPIAVQVIKIEKKTTGEMDPSTQAALERAGVKFPGPKHANTAEKILRDAGKPMTAAEIIGKMEEMGHPLPPDPHIRHSAIYSSMQRKPSVFIRISRGKWGLVGRDELQPNVQVNPESRIDQIPERDLFPDSNCIIDTGLPVPVENGRPQSTTDDSHPE